MIKRAALLLFALALLVTSALPAFARSGSKNDRVQFGSSINVLEDEEVGDVVCIGCSIRMAGTSGDVVAIGGRIDLEGHARGDVVAVGGGVRMADGSQVAGDVVTVGGALSRGSGSEVGGQIVSQGGSYVLPLLIIVPLIPVILVVALIWWLITRSNRRPIQPQPTYPAR